MSTLQCCLLPTLSLLMWHGCHFVFIAVSCFKTTLFWDIKVWWNVTCYWSFGRTYCLHLHGLTKRLRQQAPPNLSNNLPLQTAPFSGRSQHSLTVQQEPQIKYLSYFFACFCFSFHPLPTYQLTTKQHYNRTAKNKLPTFSPIHNFL
jgi:hypothetical protein